MVGKDNSRVGIDTAAQLFQSLRQKKHHRVIVVFAAHATAIKNIAQRINGDNIGRPIFERSLTASLTSSIPASFKRDRDLRRDDKVLIRNSVAASSKPIAAPARADSDIAPRPADKKPAKAAYNSNLKTVHHRPCGPEVK
jgi:hypothetical protein